jgi:hypothetical protein
MSCPSCGLYVGHAEACPERDKVAPPATPLLAFAREVVATAAKGGAEVLPLLEDPVSPHTRHHPHALILHHESKTATCRHCSVEMTAFEALVYVAKEWTMMKGNLSAIRHEIMVLEEKRVALKEDIRNLKAQKRRLSPKGK